MVIVTGANGFIGSAFVWELNQQKIKDIVAVDTIGLQARPELLAKRSVHKFLSKDEIWPFLGMADKIDCVVHMGACSSTTEMNEAFLRENNTEYTQKLWSWCAAARVPFIFASSGAVYGDGSRGFSDQTSPGELEALNPYGHSKLVVDRWILEQKFAPPKWYSVRFFNVYGPNEYHKGDMSSVVFKASGQIRETGALKLFKSRNPKYEDGKQMRDFVYVKDITRWMWELMQKNIPSGIYNMGYGEARTWLDLAEASFKAYKKPLKIDWIDIPENLRARYQYFTEARMEKLIGAGLSKPQWDLEKGVRDYIENYLRKPDTYL